ncbi:MAG: hypothetical protein KKB37_00075, partial [Alphaproteobacteria bacterium]|nr:hypothetical protein [Alphaproteobacteria bacterium]
QREFLEAEFASDPDVRTFVFIHYPIYVSDPDEPGSYDNIDEPGRSWLLGLIKRYRPEALFAAHVHNFWYDVIGETETYVLPSTCFVRHDYSEMYRIEAGDQYGRNDVAKLGFAMLDIHDEGHVVYYRRSYGGLLKPGEKPDPAVEPIRRVHTRTSGLVNLAVDMRRSWAEEFDIAPSGAVDEFGRKRARNDYPVMALWEMGLRTMRVPLQDLADARVRRRMELMAAVGHRFHVYCYGLPAPGDVSLLARHADLLAKLEVVINWEDAAAVSVELADLGAQTGLDICLSRVNRKDASKISGKQYNHLISHGFSLAELDEVGEVLRDVDSAGAIGQVMLSVPRDVCAWTAASEAATLAETSGRRLALYIKSTSASPAEAFVDEDANTLRTLQAAFAAVAYPDLDIILDAFTDADRGYFVRTGLVDSRCNPRQAGRSLSALVHGVNAGRNWRATGGPDDLRLTDADGKVIALARGADGGVRLEVGR